MSDEVEVRPVPVMKSNGNKYNEFLKSQAIRAHLNGAKFADVSKQFDQLLKGLGTEYDAMTHRVLASSAPRRERTSSAVTARDGLALRAS